jgi:hypothetical protein
MLWFDGYHTPIRAMLWFNGYHTPIRAMLWFDGYHTDIRAMLWFNVYHTPIRAMLWFDGYHTPIRAMLWFNGYHTPVRAMLWFKRLIVGFSLLRQGSDPRPVQVGFVVNIMGLGQVYCEEFYFALTVSFHYYSIVFHLSLSCMIEASDSVVV